jgi:hypothetical protein
MICDSFLAKINIYGQVGCCSRDGVSTLQMYKYGGIDRATNVSAF